METYRIDLKKEFEKLTAQPKCMVVERRSSDEDLVVFNDEIIRTVLPNGSF